MRKKLVAEGGPTVKAKRREIPSALKGRFGEILPENSWYSCSICDD